MVNIVKYKTGIDNNSLLGRRTGDSYFQNCTTNVFPVQHLIGIWK